MMRFTLQPAVLALLTWLPLLVTTSGARAYCRSTTVPPRLDTGCECSLEGEPWYWDDTTIAYAFNERGFPGVSEQDLRAVFARSFAHWTDVTCDGEPVALSVRAVPVSTPMDKEHLKFGPNTAVITHLSEADFRAASEDRESFVFALTSVAYDRNTGEILDADILFNAALGPYAVCPEAGCGGRAVDIENVATHEIGHFFGLAHSDVPGATMACRARNDDIEKRSLATDDIAGICAIYGPQAVEERTAALIERHGGPGCGCRLSADPSGTSPLGALAAACAALFLTRRRRLHR